MLHCVTAFTCFCHFMPSLLASEEDFHWISEQFLGLYYLNADQSVSVKI